MIRTLRPLFVVYDCVVHAFVYGWCPAPPLSIDAGDAADTFLHASGFDAEFFHSVHSNSQVTLAPVSDLTESMDNPTEHVASMAPTPTTLAMRQRASEIVSLVRARRSVTPPPHTRDGNSSASIDGGRPASVEKASLPTTTEAASAAGPSTSAACRASVCDGGSDVLSNLIGSVQLSDLYAGAFVEASELTLLLLPSWLGRDASGHHIAHHLCRSAYGYEGLRHQMTVGSVDFAKLGIYRSLATHDMTLPKLLLAADIGPLTLRLSQSALELILNVVDSVKVTGLHSSLDASAQTVTHPVYVDRTSPVPDATDEAAEMIASLTDAYAGPTLLTSPFLSPGSRHSTQSATGVRLFDDASPSPPSSACTASLSLSEVASQLHALAPLHPPSQGHPAQFSPTPLPVHLSRRSLTSEFDQRSFFSCQSDFADEIASPRSTDATTVPGRPASRSSRANSVSSDQDSFHSACSELEEQHSLNSSPSQHISCSDEDLLSLRASSTDQLSPLRIPSPPSINAQSTPTRLLTSRSLHDVRLRLRIPSVSIALSADSSLDVVSSSPWTVERAGSTSTGFHRSSLYGTEPEPTSPQFFTDLSRHEFSDQELLCYPVRPLATLVLGALSVQAWSNSLERQCQLRLKSALMTQDCVPQHHGSRNLLALEPTLSDAESCALEFVVHQWTKHGATALATDSLVLFP